MSKGSHRPIPGAALLAVLPILGGCVEYTIETTVNPDGSGRRTEEIIVSESEESGVSRAEFQALFYAGPEQGWAEREGGAAVGDTLAVLNRSARVPDLTAWSRLSNRVRIAGALPSQARETFGLLRLGDIQFRNNVRVGTGTLSDGGTSYTYRETFTWEGAVDALGEYLVQNLDRAVSERYPDLSSQDQGEIIGFARARFWAAVDQGYLTNDDRADQIQALAVESTVEQVSKVVRSRYPGEDETFLAETLTELYEGDGGYFEEFFTETVPGLNLAFNTEFVFRLNLPGEVVNSNAHDREGTTLVWEFEPLEAMAVPIEIYAESVLEREGIRGSR